MRHHHGMVGLAILVDQVDGIGLDGIAGGASLGDAQGVGAHDRELELLLFRFKQIQRAGVRVGDALRGDQNGLQQAIDIAFA